MYADDTKIYREIRGKNDQEILQKDLDSLTLYDPGGGGGGFKSPPSDFLLSRNFGAALLCVGDFSQKIV